MPKRLNLFPSNKALEYLQNKTQKHPTDKALPRIHNCWRLIQHDRLCGEAEKHNEENLSAEDKSELTQVLEWAEQDTDNVINPECNVVTKLEERQNTLNRP